jgi:cell wall-associated NlpC family hydrolase
MKVYIEKKDWLSSRFSIVTNVAREDITRNPILEYERMSDKQKDNERQTQVFYGETVQLLGEYKKHSLIRKYDQTIGWIPKSSLSESAATSFILPSLNILSAESFLQTWKGTPYAFGGISDDGIDCSGFTQRYFFQVHGILLPKNSKDQVLNGYTSSFELAKNSDLVFCQTKTGRENHVALFYNKDLWQSRRATGVGFQSISEFLKIFDVIEVKTLK